MLRDLTDSAALMARVADGDTASFDLLVARLHAPMLRLALRICGDRRDAEDALQAALTRLWTHAEIYEAALGSVEGWFHRILVNQCLDRRRRLRPVAPLDDAATAPAACGAAWVVVRADGAWETARGLLSVAMGYGSLFATVITLFLVPLCYLAVDDLGRAVRSLFGKSKVIGAVPQEA